MSALAFRAAYSDWKLIKTRGVVQVVMEVPLEDSDAAYDILGGMPIAGKERWFGIAPIQPVERKEASPAPRQEVNPRQPDGGKERMDWREVQPAAQSGIRANDATFQAFLRDELHYPEVTDAESAAMAIRHICHVHSRAEFSTNHKKRVLWHQLDSQFQAWQRVGA